MLAKSGQALLGEGKGKTGAGDHWVLAATPAFTSRTQGSAGLGLGGGRQGILPLIQGGAQSQVCAIPRLISLSPAWYHAPQQRGKGKSTGWECHSTDHLSGPEFSHL